MSRCNKHPIISTTLEKRNSCARSDYLVSRCSRVWYTYAALTCYSNIQDLANGILDILFYERDNKVTDSHLMCNYSSDLHRQGTKATIFVVPRCCGDRQPAHIHHLLVRPLPEPCYLVEKTPPTIDTLFCTIIQCPFSISA